MTTQQTDSRSGGRFYDPNATRGSWPRLDAVVRLTRYTQGNTLRGDQAAADLWVEGPVIETPHQGGSSYLIVEPRSSSRPLGHADGHAEYDRTRPEAWSLSRHGVTIRHGERPHWTIQHLADAEEVAAVVHLVVNGSQVARLREVLAELDDEEASDARTGAEQAALVDELRRLAAAVVVEA